MAHDDDLRTGTVIDLDLPAASGEERPARRRVEVTVHQLRVFWAIAHADTLTRAAKQLGLAQPSLSQQLSRLEQTVGARLFHRRSSEMSLTEAGEFLLPRAEHVLRGMRALEDGLAQFSAGRHATIRIAGINSVLRVILPAAVRSMQAHYPDAEYDIQESAPADTLEMLYGRRINIGLLAANSVAQDSLGFAQVPVAEDPNVLVVPERLVLDDVVDPAGELAAADLALLNSTVQFIFGTQHDKRVAHWYDEILPDHRMVAQCRSYELALGLVRAGAGVCIAPALSALVGPGVTAGVRLYRLNAPNRRIVALAPASARAQEPYATLLAALQQVGAETALPPILPTPPFLARVAMADL